MLFIIVFEFFFLIDVFGLNLLKYIGDVIKLVFFLYVFVMYFGLFCVCL